MHSPLHQGPPPLGALLHMRYRDFYPLRPESVRSARYDFRHHVTISQLDPDVAEAAELCLSELATNAVVHAKDSRPRAWFHVSCSITGRRRPYIRLGVHDADSKHIPNIPRTPVDPLAILDSESESKRGLLLVVQLAEQVHIEHSNGKTIWCRFPIHLSPPTQHSSSARRATAPALP